jgi:hypothetical protein
VKDARQQQHHVLLPVPQSYSSLRNHFHGVSSQYIAVIDKLAMREIHRRRSRGVCGPLTLHRHPKIIFGVRMQITNQKQNHGQGYTEKIPVSNELSLKFEP